MRFLLVFVDVPDDYTGVMTALVDLKAKLLGKGTATVIDVPEDDYNFLLNSHIEKANAEKRGRGT